jgi:hypothetical protein
VSLLSPSGRLVNLPANFRVTGRTTTSFTTRWFGHQLRLDPNGNIRLNTYANGAIVFDYHAVVFAG